MKLVKLLLYLLILLIPLGQLARLPLGGRGVNVYLNDLLVPLVLFSWLGYALAIRKSLKLPPLTGSILLFASIACISLINGKRWLGTQEFLVSGLYLVRWILYAGIYFVVYDLKVRITNNELRITDLLILSGVILAIAGFIQLAIFPDFTVMAQREGWDPHQNRLLSTFFDPNFTGAYLVLTLCLILPRFFRKAGPCRALLLISAAIVSAALILTFSRSAWLMFAVSIFIIGLFKSRKLLILALIVALAAYALVPRVQTRIAGGVDPDDSARARFRSWQQTAEIVKDNWLIGVGFNAFRYAQARYGFFHWSEPLGGRAGAGSDSSLLLVLAMTGIFGLAAYLLILAKIGFFSLSLLAALAGLLVESNFINSLFYPPIMLWIWTLAALTITDE